MFEQEDGRNSVTSIADANVLFPLLVQAMLRMRCHDNGGEAVDGNVGLCLLTRLAVVVAMTATTRFVISLKPRFALAKLQFRRHQAASTHTSAAQPVPEPLIDCSTGWD